MVVIASLGAAFLPHARALASLADQATTMLRARRRPLRIDVLARAAAPLDMVRAFYEASDVDVDIVVSRGMVSQRAALADGSVDAVFGRTRGTLPRESSASPPAWSRSRSSSAADTASPGAATCR